MKPQDFFIGIREFLAVLVPGLALLLIFPEIPNFVARRLDLALPGEAGAAAFAFAALLAAYGLGTLAAAAASQLDRHVDRHLIATGGACGVRLLRRAFGLDKAIAELGRARAHGENLEKEMVPTIAEADPRPWSVKAFWWNYMRLNCPSAVEELDRLEGYQKLFRAMAPITLVAAAAEHGRGWDFVLPCVAACWAFLALYMRSRIRFARRLFEFAVIASLPEDALRRAGGICFPGPPGPPTDSGAATVI